MRTALKKTRLIPIAEVTEQQKKENDSITKDSLYGLQEGVDWTVDNINWSIGDWDDEKFEESERRVKRGLPEIPYEEIYTERTEVNTEMIDYLNDGDHSVAMFATNNYTRPDCYLYYILENKITVKDGKVDVDSAKRAVSEYLNETGDWHYFIEHITTVQGSTPGTEYVTIFCGS